jgi:hypothetical protein
LATCCPHPSQSDDAYYLVGDFSEGEVEPLTPSPLAACLFPLVHGALAQADHQGEGVLGHGDGIGTAVVGHGDAHFTQATHVEAVVARA